MRKPQLLAPGPTPVPDRVRLAMGAPMIHHRTPEYAALFGEVRQQLKRLVGTAEEVLVLTCSGTGAMEAALVNTLSPGDRVAVMSAGAFAERWIELARALGLAVVALEAPYGDTVPPARLAEVLDRDPEIRAVLCQHSESSTGVLHDVRGYAAVTRERQALLVVDAVSSLGIAELRMDAWDLDVVVSGSQKGLMLPPGLAFCALGPRAWRASETARLPRYYFDLAGERRAALRSEARFTPGVSLVVGLREALVMLLDEEGLEAVWRRHDRLARAMRAGVEALGLTLFPRTTPSPALTAVRAPDGVDGERIVAAFAADHAVTIAGGQGRAKGELFRLGHMGWVVDGDVLVALAALEHVLAGFGLPVDFGASARAAQKAFA